MSSTPGHDIDTSDDGKQASPAAPFSTDGSGKESSPTQDSGTSGGWKAALSGRSAGWWAIRVVVVVVVVAVVGLMYLVSITLNPDSGPEGFKVRRIASAAEKHLSKDPNVVSVAVIEASADIGGTEADLDVRLKDDTSADAMADLLASTHDAAFGKNSPDTNINLYVTLSWTLHGTSIKTTYDCAGRPDLLRTARQDLTTAGEARTIDITGGRLNIDYGQVTAIPTTFLQPSAPRSTKTFTMNGWKVTSTSNTDGQFSNPPFDQLITATKQASPTGTIDLDGTTLSVTGLVTDENKGLTPEAAAPVVHAVNNCQAAKLTTLQLNGKLQKGLSTDNDYWMAFTCNNGTWTPNDDGSTGQDEAAILNKAAEL